MLLLLTRRRAAGRRGQVSCVVSAIGRATLRGRKAAPRGPTGPRRVSRPLQHAVYAAAGPSAAAACSSTHMLLAERRCGAGGARTAKSERRAASGAASDYAKHAARSRPVRGPQCGEARAKRPPACRTLEEARRDCACVIARKTRAAGMTQGWRRRRAPHQPPPLAAAGGGGEDALLPPLPQGEITRRSCDGSRSRYWRSRGALQQLLSSPPPPPLLEEKRTRRSCRSPPPQDSYRAAASGPRMGSSGSPSFTALPDASQVRTATSTTRSTRPMRRPESTRVVLGM